MTNTAGAFLLVLHFIGLQNAGGGGAIQLLPSQADCETVLVQLEAVYWVDGVCVSASVEPDQ